jgi:2-phosphoglycerate kinase
MKKIILIGGAPATGKTTLAKKLSKKYNCPWISTDFIRSWMKNIISKKDFPNLFHFSNITAEEYYKKHTINETIKLEKLRDKEVFKGIKTFIEKNHNWDLFIIEGISIHPEFISKLKSKNYKIYPIFFIENNEERIKNILYTRGLWGDAKTYEDWVKNIEQKYLLKTNSHYLKNCKKLKLPYFEIDKNRNKTIKKIIKHLDSKLR